MDKDQNPTCTVSQCAICEKLGIKCTVLENNPSEEDYKVLDDKWLDLCFREEKFNSLLD